MRRRGNKSHRVPNVKLRPAAAGVNPSSRPVVEEGSQCWAQETQETGALDPCPRPFKGVVLCTTGITDKPTLFKQVLELGATSSSAFTSRVTHLIAADHGGAKYLCAVERQIPILKPSWITESYQTWLRGDDVDFDKSVREHKLPLFSGVTLSFSGVTDLGNRAEITQKLTANNGIYLENLERPVKITHILCSEDEETDKMRYARKFNQRGEADIHLVWEEWFWDSLEYGGRFSEVDYDVHRPRPQRRQPAMDEGQPLLSASSESSSSHSQPSLPPPPSFDDEEEIACVAHRAEFTVQIWGSLLKNRGYEVVNGEVLRSPSKAPKAALPMDMPRADSREPNAMEVDLPKTRSVISTFRRANSFAPANHSSQPSHSSQRLQPFRKTSNGITPAQPRQPNGQREANENAQAGPSTIGPRGIFSGLKFRVLGEARSTTVRNAVEQAGGVWISEQDIDEEVDYIIVRLVSGSKFYREELDNAERAKYRTECWLERCLHAERVCPYEEHVTFLPLGIQLPIAGTENIVVSFSGLDQSETCWLTRLLRALGIQLAQAFSRRTTHLLCPSGAGLKYDKAKEWGIPVVDKEWVATIASTGLIPAVTNCIISPNSMNDPIIVNGDKVMDAKGKGKEKEPAPPQMLDEPDAMMNDVTNGRIDRTNSVTQDGVLSHLKPIYSHSAEQLPLPTQAEPPDHREQISFGQPTRLPEGRGSLVNPTTPTRKRPPIPQPQQSFIMDGYGLRNELSSPPSSQFQAEAMVPPPIPSSRTPSPMKLPQDGSTASLLSPMKINQALQESVTSLLGKRQGEDEDGRNGKRSRPQRRAMSKHSSSSSLNFDIRLASEPDGMQAYDAEAGRDIGMSNFAVGAAGESITETGITLLDESLDKNMLVMYEDPGQVDERRRLMTLLKNATGNTEGTGVSVKHRTRRSTRLALAGAVI